MTLPKFIRIETPRDVTFINVNAIQYVDVTDSKIKFVMRTEEISYTGTQVQLAKDAWLDYWKVSP